MPERTAQVSFIVQLVSVVGLGSSERGKFSFTEIPGSKTLSESEALDVRSKSVQEGT